MTLSIFQILIWQQQHAATNQRFHTMLVVPILNFGNAKKFCALVFSVCRSFCWNSVIVEEWSWKFCRVRVRRISFPFWAHLQWHQIENSISMDIQMINVDNIVLQTHFWSNRTSNPDRFRNVFRWHFNYHFENNFQIYDHINIIGSTIFQREFQDHDQTRLVISLPVISLAASKLAWKIKLPTIREQIRLKLWKGFSFFEGTDLEQAFQNTPIYTKLHQWNLS